MTMQTLKLLAASVIGASALLATPAFAQKGQNAPAAAECGANSDPAACRREAAAARAAARTGALTPGDKANALARCEVQAVPAADRDLCRRRVEQGQVSGSVEGGGQLIEYREVIEIPPGK
jgi:hypothetical protein